MLRNHWLCMFGDVEPRWCIGISPDSSGSHVARGSGGFSPGSYGTFSPGWSHQLGLKGLAPDATSLLPVGGSNWG